jgi:FkbM family methyltransferase
VLRELQKSLNQQVRKHARTLGCDVRRANVMNVWELRLPLVLKNHGIRTVLDVGANEGQYACALLENGFPGSIVSFEPLPGAWIRLREKAKRFAPRWAVADRIAVSDENGEATFFEAGNSVSSSLLPMARSHATAAPESAIVQKITVSTARLDDYLAQHAVEAPLFLKMDVQGAESLVLQGAEKSLRESITGVQLEMSLKALYEGQQLYWESDRFLRSEGFQCCDIITEFRDPASLDLLQYDSIYFR